MPNDHWVISRPPQVQQMTSREKFGNIVISFWSDQIHRLRVSLWTLYQKYCQKYLYLKSYNVMVDTKCWTVNLIVWDVPSCESNRKGPAAAVWLRNRGQQGEDEGPRPNQTFFFFISGSCCIQLRSTSSVSATFLIPSCLLLLSHSGPFWLKSGANSWITWKKNGQEKKKNPSQSSKWRWAHTENI